MVLRFTVSRVVTFSHAASLRFVRVPKREQICQLEDGHKAFAFSTGMAALSAVTRLVRAGQEIILNNDSYGGTYRLLSKVKNKHVHAPPPSLSVLWLSLIHI